MELSDIRASVRRKTDENVSNASHETARRLNADPESIFYQ
jgi:hypothetical protein